MRKPKPKPDKIEVCCAVCGSLDVQYAIWYSPTRRQATASLSS